MSDQSAHTKLEKLQLYGKLVWMLVVYIPVDIAQGIYHLVRCELIANEWSWETYEAEIGDETYEFKRCERCKWDQRAPGAYI